MVVKAAKTCVCVTARAGRAGVGVGMGIGIDGGTEAHWRTRVDYVQCSIGSIC